MIEIYLTFRYTLALIFLLSGVPKVFRIEHYKEAIKEYRILPQPLIAPYAYLSIGIEVISGVSLLLGYNTIQSAVALFFLLMSYTIAIGINLYRKADLNCHCFESIIDSKLTIATLLRALFFLGSSAWLILYDFGIFSTFPQDKGESISIIHLIIYMFLVVVLLILIEAVQQGMVLAARVKTEYEI